MEEQKYMTLNDLLRELKKVTSTLTSGEIPLRINGKKVISVEHDVVTDDECHVIECNLKVGLQSNLDRLKEIAEPAPTDWREAAEERRMNREQYHKELHEWLEKKINEEMSDSIDEKSKMIITLMGIKSNHFPEMWCECENFSIDFNFDDLPKYLTGSYAELNNAKNSSSPLTSDVEEEINELESKFFEKCDAYLKSYFENSFVWTKSYTIKF